MSTQDTPTPGGAQEGLAELKKALGQAGPQGATALTIGVFDGVHLGHQHVIGRLVAKAEHRGLVPVVFTFSNHPRSVLRPEEPLVWITSLEDRLALLRATGIEWVIPVTFTRALSLLTAEEFLMTLSQALGMQLLVVGPDFAMGHNRQGTIAVLEELGRRHGFSLEVVEPLKIGGVAVKSSTGRQALATGDVERVEQHLGRPFHLTGLVEQGKGQGHRELGFPTVNLALGPHQAVLADGVYAAWCSVGGQRYQAAASIGTRPTFPTDDQTVVEAYLLDFEGDLYGQEVRLEFVRRLRPQERYASVEELVAQMRRDVAAIRNALEPTATATRSQV